MPHGEKAPPGVIVWFQTNGWMDTKLMNDYVDYLKDTGISGPRTPKMMVYDSFKGHLEDSVKKKFHEAGFDLAVIPGGLTSVCQPLDVAINKPFKDNLRKEWHLWMANGGAGQTPAGNLRRARLSDICNWIKCLWDAILPEIIIQSFKTCGVSSPLILDEDTDKENTEFEEFEIVDVSDDDIGSLVSETYKESVDMMIPCARYKYSISIHLYLIKLIATLIIF